MLRAQECDEKAKKVWFDAHPTAYFTELMTCDRREALMHLAAGKPLEAVRCLARAPELYLDRFKHAGLNLIEVSVLRPIMDALKVLADAFAQTDNQKYVVHGRWIRVDVEETEAIWAGYWEGVLEETRRALAEQQRATAAAAVAPVAAGGEAAATKKNKAGKRKQQKRKAQQKKKAAEVAEAAVAASGQNESEQQTRNDEGQTEGEQKEEQEDNDEEAVEQ